MNENFRAEYKYVHVARIVLESQSAFSVNSGLSDAQFDNLVVRDANQLPAIPGTTLAGILRHLYHDTHSDTEITITIPEQAGRAEEDIQISAAQEMFGLQHQESNTSRPSALQVSWGYIHNCEDKPVDALLSLDTITADKILNRLVMEHPLRRDRVRINSKGVADDQGKFDHTVIPAGCRFTAELTLWWGEAFPPQWTDLLGVLSHPLLRIGGSTRSGFGQFKIDIVNQLCFDLSDREQFGQFAAMPVSFTEPWPTNVGSTNLKLTDQVDDEGRFENIALKLEPEDFWRFGQGDQTISADKSRKPPDTMPVTEDYIKWDAGQPTFESRAVAPGSGQKGALKHRTLYHLYRVLRKGQPDITNEEVEDVLGTLFGCATDHDDRNKGSGQAGRLFISDSYVDLKDARQASFALTHNSIDRYTGGVRDKVLFTEELLWRSPLTMRVLVDKRVSEPEISERLEKCLQALKLAIDDIQQGRLALGAASAKGHGFFHSADSTLQEDRV